MKAQPQYLVVEASLLPEVFLKVVEANRLLQSNRVKTINEAVEKVGLSRSAYYKYKDGVKPFFEATTDRIVTFHILLSDEPGNLSSILSLFARMGANILTINQSIPINGQAAVTISARTDGMKSTVEALLKKGNEIPGVTRMEVLASQ